MARSPKGTITSLATAMSAAKTITGITNAVEAVCTSTAHGMTNGAIVLVKSGWGRLNMKAFRIKTVTTDAFTLEGCDTTNLEFFPAGSGAGSVQAATTWTDLDRTFNWSSSGGDPKTITQPFIESEVDFVLNDGFNAVTRTFSMDADMIGSPGYQALKTLSQTGGDTIVRQRAKKGSFSLIPANIAFNEEEVLTEGQIVSVGGSIIAQNTSTRYAAP